MTKNNFFIVTLFFFLLYNGINTQVSIIKSFPIDDIIVLLMLVYIIYTLLTRKISLFRFEIYLFILFILFIFLGIISNLLLGNAELTTIILDIWSVSKFLIVYYFSRVFYDVPFNELHLNKISKISIFLSYSLLALLIFNLTFNYWGYFEYRNGLPSQFLFFSHPTYLASFSLILAFFIAQSKKTNAHLIPLLIVTIYSGRNKAVMFLMILIFLTFLIKYSKKIPYILISIVTIIVLFLFKDVIYTRLLSQETSARLNLYEAAINLSERYFPLGSGFGTFGSFASVKNYSPIYFDYGFNNIYGFSPEYPMYLMDGYYAMSLGQFGIIGLSLFLMVISFIFYLAIKTSEFSLLSLSVSFYIIVSLFTENLLSTSLGLSLMLILGNLINQKKVGRDYH